MAMVLLFQLPPPSIRKSSAGRSTCFSGSRPQQVELSTDHSKDHSKDYMEMGLKVPIRGPS